MDLFIKSFDKRKFERKTGNKTFLSKNWTCKHWGIHNWTAWHIPNLLRLGCPNLRFYNLGIAEAEETMANKGKVRIGFPVC